MIAALGALLTGAVEVISLFAPRTLLQAVGEGSQTVTTGTQIFATYTGEVATGDVYLSAD